MWEGGLANPGFSILDLGNRDENFPLWTLYPGYRNEKSLTK